MIPDAAVEAAAATYDNCGCEGPADLVARAALEAAAPHMLAAGWDEGYTAGVREEQPGWTKNPYRPAK